MSIRLPMGTFFGINVTEGLTLCLNDHELYWSQILYFQEKYGDSALRLKTLIAHRQWEDAEVLTHTLKGTSGMLGLTDLQDAATLLDFDLKTARDTGSAPDKIAIDLEQVRNALVQMSQGIKTIAASLTSL